MFKSIKRNRYKYLIILIPILIVGSFLSILIADGIIKQSNKLFKFNGDKLVQNISSYPASFTEVKRKDAKISNNNKYVGYVEGRAGTKDQSLRVYSIEENKDIAAFTINTNRDLFVLSWSDKDQYIALAERNMQVPETTIQFFEINKKNLKLVAELDTYNTTSAWINSKFIFFTVERNCKEGNCKNQTYLVNVLDLSTKSTSVIGILESDIISGESIYPQLGTAKIIVEDNRFTIKYDMEKSGKIYETKFKSYTL